MELVHGSLNINKEKNQKATKKLKTKQGFSASGVCDILEGFFKIENSFVFEVIKSSEALKASHKARTLCLATSTRTFAFQFFFCTSKSR